MKSINEEQDESKQAKRLEKNLDQGYHNAQLHYLICQEQIIALTAWISASFITFMTLCQLATYDWRLDSNSIVLQICL